ncbi:MAG: DUF1826 domain-containing protein [Rickettsiales bacterium]|nr:DUF1826 domain-containing protein [Rickettsiales bacterium]
MILQTTQFEAVAGFSDMDERLAIIQRREPESEHFFDALIVRDMETFGVIPCDGAEQYLQSMLEDKLPQQALQHSFYPHWIKDIAQLCWLFGGLMKTNQVSVWLGTNRGCRRYHTDNVPMRLVVTYSGRGTEWLPEEAANRDAYKAGAPNENILTDPNARQWLEPWDVGIFKGGQNGVLHRTPDDALYQRTLLLRIDHAEYWNRVYKNPDDE